MTTSGSNGRPDLTVIEPAHNGSHPYVGPCFCQYCVDRCCCPAGIRTVIGLAILGYGQGRPLEDWPQPFRNDITHLFATRCYTYRYLQTETQFVYERGVDGRPRITAQTIAKESLANPDQERRDGS